MARESRRIPHTMRKVYSRFERWRSRALGPLADCGSLGGCSGGAGPGARRYSHRTGLAFGVWQAEGDDGISESDGEVSDGEGPCKDISIQPCRFLFDLERAPSARRRMYEQGDRTAV